SRSTHVLSVPGWLCGAFSHRLTASTNSRLRTTAPSSGASSMPPVIRDPALHLRDRVVREGDGLGAVAALVVRGGLEVGLRGAEMFERGLHAGLGGRGVASHEAGGEDGQECQDGEETASSHRDPPFFDSICYR